MSKKIRNVITIIALCMGLILVSTEVKATSAKTINNTTRIREKATTDSALVELASKGESLEILDESGEWYKVKYGAGKNAVTGYIRKDLVEVEGAEQKETKQEANTEEKEEQSKEESKQEEETASETNQEEKQEAEQEVENTENNDSKVEETDSVKLNSDAELQLMPIIYSCKTDTLSANTEVTVTEVVGNWSHIEAGEKEGWILTSKVASNNSNTQQFKVEEKKEEKVEEVSTTQTEANTNKKYVSTVTLNLREKANAESKVLTQLNQDEEVTVIKVVDSTWCKVKVKGYEGYTASEYLKDKKESVTSRSADDTRKEDDAKKKAEEEEKKKAAEAARLRAEAAAIVKKEEEEAKKKAEAEAKKKAAEQARARAEALAKAKAKVAAKEKTSRDDSVVSNGKGADIVAYAKKYLGCRYVYGAEGPNTFDCSGFTSYVYKHFGYSLSRTSSAQRSNGKAVSKSNKQPGDLLCFSGHVGIYIGGNKFIHASHPGDTVKISSLSGYYTTRKPVIAVRRIIK